MAEKVICRIPFRHEGIHECTDLITHCSDFRFKKGIGKLERVLGIEESDGIRIPGGPKDINDPDVGANLFEQIELLVKAHGIKNIWLVSHSNCGAYAKAGFVFNDFDEEQEFHFAELRKAKSRLGIGFPDLKVRMIYARISRDKKHIEFVEVE